MKSLEIKEGSWPPCPPPPFSVAYGHEETIGDSELVKSKSKITYRNEWRLTNTGQHGQPISNLII